MNCYYFDKATNRIWNTLGHDRKNVLVTPMADLDFSSAVPVDFEDERYVHVWSKNHEALPFSIYPTLTILKDKDNNFCVMVLYYDTMNEGCVQYSLHGNFCYKHVYAYYESKDGVEYVRLALEDVNGAKSSYSVVSSPDWRGLYPVVLRPDICDVDIATRDGVIDLTDFSQDRFDIGK